MDVAVFLSPEETAALRAGDTALLQKIRKLATTANTQVILGKDEDGPLYDISDEVVCEHTNQRINDRSEFICADCAEVLGR